MFSGSMMNPFDNDPFFQQHREHMQRMNSMFQDPFGHRGMGGMPSMALTDGREHQRDRQRRGERHRHSDVAQSQIATQDPFGGDMFGNMFGNMNRMMCNMRSMMGNMQPQMLSVPRQSGAGGGPGGASNFYSQSTVMTYSNDGTNKPKVYQATTSTRQTGDVKETQHSVRDSHKGTEKMAVGHHIGDRAHIITKEKNRHTGDINEEQELVNLDEEDVSQFDGEWKEKTRFQSRSHHRLEGQRRPAHRSHDHAAASRGLGYVPSPVEGKPAKRTGAPADQGLRGKNITSKDSKRKK